MENRIVNLEADLSVVRTEEVKQYIQFRIHELRTEVDASVDVVSLNKRKFVDFVLFGVLLAVLVCGCVIGFFFWLHSSKVVEHYYMEPTNPNANYQYQVPG